MDIVSIFQKIVRNHINLTEDGGCNMRTIYAEDCYIQCYIDDSFHNVYFGFYSKNGNEPQDSTTIFDYSKLEQLRILRKFYLINKRKNNKNI